MMDIEEFKRSFEDAKPALRAWGDYVVEVVKRKVSEFNGELSPEFFKVQCKPRIKELSSSLEKIERKKYENPFSEMTDLVGVRFVVLTNNDLESLEKVIEHAEWNVIISKDFSHEVHDAPKVFDYQSKHYEVRPSSNFVYNETLVEQHICCEIQIRTLLQHAYAELVHDNIYKAEGSVPPSAVRYVSRSMALMETTDELFCYTLEALKKENYKVESVMRYLEKAYISYVDKDLMETDRSLHFNILECFKDYLDECSEEEIYSLLERKQFIVSYVLDRAPCIDFFRQPVVIFLYWFVERFGEDEFSSFWEFGVFNKEADFILSDLGKSKALRGR